MDNNRRQYYPGIKLIPACVMAHQWPQTNRQSDFMLWPGIAMATGPGHHGNSAGSHSGALIHKRVTRTSLR